jgi:hypothetical protein
MLIDSRSSSNIFKSCSKLDNHRMTIWRRGLSWRVRRMLVSHADLASPSEPRDYCPSRHAGFYKAPAGYNVYFKSGTQKAVVGRLRRYKEMPVRGLFKLSSLCSSIAARSFLARHVRFAPFIRHGPAIGTSWRNSKFSHYCCYHQDDTEATQPPKKNISIALWCAKVFT